MNIFSALCESIRRVFGAKPAAHQSAEVKQSSPEPIQPVVMTPAASPVTQPAPAPKELVIEQGAYRPTVSGPKDPPTLQQPAPIVETKAVTEAKPEKPAKKSKEPKAPKTPKEPKAVKPKTEKRVKKSN